MNLPEFGTSEQKANTNKGQVEVSFQFLDYLSINYILSFPMCNTFRKHMDVESYEPKNNTPQNVGLPVWS